MGYWSHKSCISKELATKLGLTPYGVVQMNHADGSVYVDTHFVNIYLPNRVAFRFLKVLECGLNGVDILIGMDVISKGDFAIGNVGGKTTFSFRFPSIQKIDFVQIDKKIENDQKISDEARINKVGRNELCPCGSKKKYKYCHGKQ